MNHENENDCEQKVAQWKVKKLVKSLEAVRGNGTSMISLVIPPREQIARVVKLLSEEFGKASNIKSRVNRLSVESAIVSTQQRLKLYKQVPPNGLVVYCGTIVTDEGKEKKINIDFEPHKPINTSLYLCDNKFHTDALSGLLDPGERYGVIVMDGSETLFGMVCGNNKEVLHRLSVDLPKKHARGGQSSARFGRIRLEKRHNYVHKVAELATQFYIENNKAKVDGLILAGSGGLKKQLAESDLFDPRLANKVIKIVDVSYGGANGFDEAIGRCAEQLSGVKLVQEKKLLSRYFEEIARDTGMFCFGIADTLSALEQGAVETLIVWDNLETVRFVLRNAATREESVRYLTKEDQEKGEHAHPLFGRAQTGAEVVERVPLLEWLADNYKKFGAAFEMVTDRSQEGSQFCRGFGGVGGLLRYRVEFPEPFDEENDSDPFDGAVGE